MASIPCAAYQAGSIHGELRRQHLVKMRSQSSFSGDESPPPSPGKPGHGSQSSKFGQFFSRQISWPWNHPHPDTSTQQQVGNIQQQVSKAMRSQSFDTVTKSS